MTDLATLGLAVDSSQVRTAAADLRNLESAAKRAGISVDEMRARVQKANDEAGKTGPTLANGNARQVEYSKSVDKVAKSLEAQYARLTMTGKEFSVYQNLVKAGVTIQSEAGQKIATATRQIYDMEMAQKQLRAANDNTSSSFERMTTRFMRGFIVGIALQGVRDLTRALISMNTALAAVGDSSKRVGLSNGQFQQLQAVAGYKGISFGDLGSSAQELAANLNIGVKYSNDLSRLFAANNLSLKDSAGNAKSLVTVLANVADLVRNARTEQDKFRILQEAGIPATSQWLRLLEDGGVAFKLALEDAKRAGVETNDALIRKAQEFDDKWNQITTNLSMNIRGFFADAINGFERLSNSTGFKVVVAAWQLFQSVRAINSAMWGGGNPSSGAQSNASAKSDALPRNNYTPQNRLNDSFKLINDSNAAVANANRSKLNADIERSNQLELQRIGILGQMASVGDQVRAVELNIAQARRQGVNILPQEEAALKAIARENALGITAMKAQADAYKTQAGTIGMSLGQAVAYTAEQNRLNEATRNHQTLTEADKAAIHASAVAMGEAAQASAEKLAKDQALFDLQTAGLTGVDQQIAQLQFRLHGKDWQQFMNDGLAATMRLTDAMRQMNDAVKGFGQDLLSSLQQGKDLFTSLLGAASNFATKLANMGLDKMMSGLTGGGDFSKVFGGDLGSAIGKGVKQSLDDIELKSRNAATNPANGFMFNGSGGVGKGLAGIAAGLGIYAQGQQIGASGGSATTGALSGALSGALAGSAILPGIGTAIGAVVGGIAGLLGASDGAKKAAQQAKDDWANAKTAADLFGKQLAGTGQGSLTSALAQAKSQTEQYTIMAQKAKDQESSDRLGEQYNQYYKRMTEAFRDSFGGIVDAFNSGLGPNSPFATGAKNVKDIGDELKGFIEDTKTAMSYLTPGAEADAVAKATAASQKYLLSLLGQAPVLTDTQTAIQHLNGTAAQLQTTLVDLGVSSQDAASAIQAGVLASMKQLADTFANGLQREINAASGQDYLNSLSDLVAKFQSNLADAAALGLGPDLVNKWFKVSAQKIVDDAGLAGDAIAGLVRQFPSLANVITASVASLQAAYDAATNDVGTVQGKVDEARSNLEKSYQTESSRLNDLISRTQSFIKTIQQFKDSLKLDQNLSPLDPYQRLVEAQKQFQQVSADALGGNQDAMDRVQDVSRAYLDEAKAYYGSSAQYFDIFNAVNSVLDSALATANSQLTAEQQSLALLNQQVDGLITINDSVLSVGDAIAALTGAQSALAQAILAQSQAQSDLVAASPQSNVDSLYQSVLGRSADAAGKAYWQQQIAGGLSGSDLLRSFISGAYAKGGADATAAAAYAAKYGYQNGGIVGMYANGGIVGNGLLGIDSVMARYAGGGYIGLAGGEYVMPTSQTRANLPQLEAMRSGRSAGNDNSNVVAELRSLRQQNAELTQRLIAVAGAGAQMNADATRENTGAVRQQTDAARREKYRRVA